MWSLQRTENPTDLVRSQEAAPYRKTGMQQALRKVMQKTFTTPVYDENSSIFRAKANYIRTKTGADDADIKFALENTEGDVHKAIRMINAFRDISKLTEGWQSGNATVC